MNLINKVLDFKENVPQNVRNALNKIGNKQIITARLGRTPVQAIIQGALKTITNVPYDDLFHLFIELTLDNGQIWILEKIERINLVKENRSNKTGAEFLSPFPVNKTVNELFTNTKKQMGDKFLPYQSANNNCQVFIMGVLNGNGLNNSERTSFVKQDTKSIFKGNPALRKFANTLTDIGGYGNALIQTVTNITKTKPKKTNPLNDSEPPKSDLLNNTEPTKTLDDVELKPKEEVKEEPNEEL
jgi:hypothetical protein